ncbi:MAG TPA: DUF305 domain-containing protein [Longimicrobium sp.]|nr:DUF305 domain-containing protein [Longimicrobium sp.]
MTNTRIRTFAAAVLAAAAVASAALAPPAAAQGHTHGHSHAPAAAPAPGDTGRWTAADVRFMSKMIGHHAQAIQMAQLAPQRAATPSVRTLAERIINAQRDEILTMQQWLRDRRQPVPEAEPHTAGHAGHGGGELMPGMLTPAQLAELERARGAEFDRLFLTYMIQHHRGATQMVSELFSSYGAGQDETVFKFASDVNVDQATEIARMQRMLAGVMFGSTVP